MPRNQTVYMEPRVYATGVGLTPCRKLPNDHLRRRVAPAGGDCEIAPPVISGTFAATRACNPHLTADTVVVEGDHHHHTHVKELSAEKWHKDLFGKKCGFPWGALVILVGLIVAMMVWVWWDMKKRRERLASAAQLAAAAASGASAQMAAAGSAIPATAMAAVAGAASGMEALRAQQAQASASPMMQAQQARNAVMHATYADVEKRAQAGQPTLVIFTWNGCSACPPAAAQLRAAAEYLIIPVLSVERDNIPENERPGGYPQIFVVMPDGSKEVFDGNPSRDAILDFVVSKLGQNVLIPSARQVV